MLSLTKRKIELVRTIIKSGPIHVNALISKMNISPTMAVSYINELVNSGILKEVHTGTNVRKIDIDYDSDFALNIAAAVCVMEGEDFIKSHPDVKLLFRKLQESKEVTFALVFGSYARGIESPESDIDLSIVSKGKRLSREMFVEELNLVDKKISFMFETESEFRRMKNDAVHKSIRQSFIIVKNPAGYLLAAAKAN